MDEQLPIWHDSGVEPPTLLKTNGWQPGMKPSAQHMNWLFNRIYKCLEEIQAGGGMEELEQELADLQQTLTTHLAERASLTDIGHTQLSNSIVGTSETKAATELAVKNAKENAITDAINFAKSFGLGDVARHLSGASLNDLGGSGLYMGDTLTGAPTNGWYFIEHFRHNNLYAKQVAHAFTSAGNETYMRTQTGGIWGTWVRIIDSNFRDAPYSFAGLDGAGKLTANVMPSSVDAYTLISTTNLGTNPTSTLSLSGFSGYKKIRIVIKNLVGSVSNASFYVTFNKQWDRANEYSRIAGASNSGTAMGGSGQPIAMAHSFPSIPNGLSHAVIDIDNKNDSNVTYEVDHIFSYSNADGNFMKIFGLYLLRNTPVNSLVIWGADGIPVMTSGVIEVWGVAR